MAGIDETHHHIRAEGVYEAPARPAVRRAPEVTRHHARRPAIAGTHEIDGDVVLGGGDMHRIPGVTAVGRAIDVTGTTAQPAVDVIDEGSIDEVTVQTGWRAVIPGQATVGCGKDGGGTAGPAVLGVGEAHREQVGGRARLLGAPGRTGVGAVQDGAADAHRPELAEPEKVTPRMSSAGCGVCQYQP